MNRTHLSRRALLAAGGTALLAGCLDGGTSDISETDLDADIQPVTVGDDSPPGAPANAPPVSDRKLPLPMPPDELVEHAEDGGPGKDGIPSIDDPVFVEPDEAAFADDDMVVMGIAGDDDVKAYTRRIFVRHEIVNDVIDGDPCAVTYCPLTGTALGFERGDTEFGVSGMLINNNLVMYDRETDRWWPQIPAVSIPGPWSDLDGGSTLREFEIVRTTWGNWREEYPETVILSEGDTGYARDYDRDPYGERGYYSSDGTIFSNIHTDDRYHAKRWVYGIRSEAGATAFLRDTVHDAGVVHGRVGETPHVAVYDPTLDTAYIYENPDDETFSYDDGRIVDADGDDHHPRALPLERAISFDAFWFAWAAYYPETTVYE